MNRSRVIVLVAAVVAAGLAALLVRSLLGGGTEKSKAAIPPPQIAMVDVMVAANDIPAGTALSPTSARWQAWPKSSIDDTLITRQMAPNIPQAVQGTVARTPLMEGQPLTTTNIVHTDAVGYMSAQLSPGMRAVSIKISTESGAGGFILPNDRVDILMTTQISDNPRTFATHALLKDIRVLAIGQTYDESKDQKTALGGTATLELTPHQADTIQRADAAGSLSLSLRPLGESAENSKQLAAAHAREDDNVYDGGVAVIRYGIAHANTNPNQNMAGE